MICIDSIEITVPTAYINSFRVNRFADMESMQIMYDGTKQVTCNYGETKCYMQQMTLVHSDWSGKSV